MSVDVVENRTRKARKPHSCDYCGEIIEKGEEYEYQKNIFDGTFYEWHTHLACSRVASAIWDYCDPDDGMSDQDFTDGCQEVCQNFVCPDCPKWNKEYGDCDEDKTYCINKMDEFFKTHELYMTGRKAYYEIWGCREKPFHKEGMMKDKTMMMYDHIRSLEGIEPWAIDELRKVLDAYLADGCQGCAYDDMREWELPCSKCKWNCKDYWRRADET